MAKITEQRAKHVQRQRVPVEVPTDRNRKPAVQRWEELLRVSAEIFAERGYDATSLQDIADRIGIFKGSLYHYINSKEELLYEIIRGVLDEAIRRVEEVTSGPEKAIDRLQAGIVTHLEHLMQNHVETAVFLHEYQQLSPERRRQIPTARYEAIFRECIMAAQAEGSVRAGLDSLTATRVVLGAINWVYRWYRPEEVANRDRLAKEIADQILFGLAKQ
jgi:AcrR family transcriptional regulator